MKVKFSRCTSNGLTNVPQVDGQLIYVKDTSEVYMDVGNSRNKLSDVVDVADISNVQNPITSKIYFDGVTNKLYKYINNAWVNLSDVEQVSQVYYWERNSETDVAFWQNIYNQLKNNPKLTILVLTMTSSGKFCFGGLYTHLQIEFNQVPFAVLENIDDGLKGGAGGEYSRITRGITLSVTFTVSNGTITDVTVTNVNRPDIGGYLRTDYEYNTPYIPLYPGSPATKKYVDDAVGDINTILDTINGEVV